MKGRVRLMCMLIVCIVLFSACASRQTVAPVLSQSDERLLSYMKTQYQNASVIVRGTCEQTHTNAQGIACYDLTVEDVLAGDAQVGDVIHCTSGKMHSGENYLLYLNVGEDVDYAEDMQGYELLSEVPLQIVDNEVIYDGKRISMQVVEEDMQKMQAVISAPAPMYYYNQLTDLIASAEEIFIGRVQKKPRSSAYLFSTRNGGVSERGSFDASVVTIEAYGAIKGALRYGETIEMVYAPTRIDSMIDAATLLSMECTMADLPQLEEGNVYLFFLNSGPDPKQSYYFPVNPLQGFVQINGETLSVTPMNQPVSVFATLTPLVQAVKTVLQGQQDSDREQGQSPALIVNENHS